MIRTNKQFHDEILPELEFRACLKYLVGVSVYYGKSLAWDYWFLKDH